MTHSPVITSCRLSRSFGFLNAVSQLDISINRGELYGLVGPDGSGKTTTMRLLAGIMDPTEGDAQVAGFSIRTDPEEVKARIGYMSQRFGLYEDLTVLENILFYADLYEVPERERTARISRLLAFSNLEPFQQRLTGALSGGMKQKLGLACALVHTPEVLLLDEPTNGVDPVSRRDFWRILYDLLRQGVTILLSTSYLDEAERCTRIGLIHRGGIILEGEPLQVRNSFKAPMIELWPDRVREAGAIARGIGGVHDVTVYGDRLHITLAPGMLPADVVGGLTQAGIAVLEHRDILPSLEDIFIALVRGI
ncbi:MAG: ABC transporter ATP-binding protein [Nitrospirae bacterium]|nr:ABC transporter ATP-binding protein [Nitrospirota bacterium]